MAKIVIARQLPGKKIVTTDGDDLGKLIDITINEKTGKLEFLIVEPNESLDFKDKLNLNEEGYAYVPFDSVLAVSDYIIVDKRMLLTQ